jgi:SAM-dependent methyltransferase
MAQTRWNDAGFKQSLESLVWTASPVVRRYLHVLATGDPACDWLTWVAFHDLPERVGRTLVLGCGSGWLERALAKSPKFEAITACDFAEETVARAAEEAKTAGIDRVRYHVVNLETDELPAGPFDVVIANDVLHHITNLERIYERIAAALTPDGRLVFNEFVGPNRFQYSDERVKIINRYFRKLPSRLRRDPVKGGVVRRWARVEREQLIAQDPTEAVRSEEVLPLARRYFEPIREIPYGGGLLNPMLFGIVVNFRDGERKDDAILQKLCDEEKRLTAAGKLENDFVIFLGRPRRSGPRVGR